MTGTARAISSPVVLGDGRVMVAGGVTANIVALTANAVGDVSIYNNTTNTWQNGPNLALGRYGSPAVLIGGKVVLGGGVVGSVSSTTTPSTTASVEQYNPISNTWAGLVPMLEPRAAQAVGLTPMESALSTWGRERSRDHLPADGRAVRSIGVAQIHPDMGPGHGPGPVC